MKIPSPRASVYRSKVGSDIYFLTCTLYVSEKPSCMRHEVCVYLLIDWRKGEDGERGRIENGGETDVKNHPGGYRRKKAAGPCALRKLRYLRLNLSDQLKNLSGEECTFIF